MERPNTVVGLALHLARTRWQALSSTGRMAVVALGTAAVLGGAWGAHAASSHGCCHGGCSAHRPMQAAQDDGGGCPYSRH